MAIGEDSDIDYKKISYYILIALVVLSVLWLNYCSLRKHMSSNSQIITDFQITEKEMKKTRDPAVAGIFYAGDRQQLEAEVAHYLSADFNRTLTRPKILIVPHAGFRYSAPVAAQAYLQLKKYSKNIKNVILVGPSHHVAFNGIAASGAAYFKTPLGQIGVNRALIRKLLENNPHIGVFEQAHEKEHSLEVQLPYLQKVLKDFKIVPLVYGQVPPQVLADALRPFLADDGTIIIFSADLSHYYNYEKARELDAETADKIRNKEADISGHMSCGATGINAAVLLAKTEHLRPEMLEMANSGDTSGSRDSVVGYGAWSFGADDGTEAEKLPPLEQEMQNLKNFTRFYGDDLLKIARRSLEEAVLNGNEYSPSRSDYPDAVFNKGAAFVTLTQKGELRGCIGTVVPNQAVALDVARNTYGAALQDSRFKPVTKEELPEIRFSISLLTSFEPISFSGEEDLLRQLQPGTDGLIIRDGDRQGLFLPSVWEQLPDRKSFLENLKLKAGLSPSYWSDNMKVYRFRTLEIKEDEN